MNFGLLTTGFARKRLPDIRADLVTAWKAGFGENAKTDPDSPDGHVIDILATQLAEVWEAAEDSYLGKYIATASGAALDLAVEDLGLVRLASVASTVAAVLYGVGTTVVPLGSLVATTDNGDRFALDLETTLGASTDAYAVEIADVVIGETHTVTIDGTPFSYMAAGIDTDEDVRDALVALIVVSHPSAAIGRVDGGGAVLQVTGVSGLVVTTTGDTPANTVLHDGEAATLTAEETGPIPAVAESLAAIVSSVTGWVGLGNALDATVGRATETDAELRARARELLEARGTATPDAIADRLVLEVEGCTAARVFENTSDVVDGDGRPPHSFEAVTLGGTAADVAQKIWDLKAAGIATFGDLATGVVDTNGDAHTVNHSLATEIYAHLLITVTKGEDFPATPEADLATQIIADVAAYGDANLSLGNDLYRLALNPTIIAALGGSGTAASSIVITTGTTPGPLDPTPALSAVDIPAASEEIVILDTGRIAVVFV